jgi:TorA maturation chaperone TorD
METEVLLLDKEYRRDSYKLLSECYYLPDEGLIKMLRSLDTPKNALHRDIVKNLPEGSGIDSLEVDYSKLFVGPYSLLAPPYGSVYLESTGMVMGNSTVDVRDRYAEEGLAIDLKEVPDHIAIELEFMYFLIFKENEAKRNHDPENTLLYQRKQRAFLETHLGIWVSDFADRVERGAQTEFYKNLARVTKSFITNDLNLLVDSFYP